MTPIQMLNGAENVNFVFSQWTLPASAAVASAALQPPSISPSLWALKIEIGFYLIFPFLWIAVRRYGGWALAAIFIPSAIYSFILSRLDMTELGRQLPGRLT